jgi:hypothetical protein
VLGLVSALVVSRVSITGGSGATKYLGSSQVLYTRIGTGNPWALIYMIPPAIAVAALIWLWVATKGIAVKKMSDRLVRLARYFGREDQRQRIRRSCRSVAGKLACMVAVVHFTEILVEDGMVWKGSSVLTRQSFRLHQWQNRGILVADGSPGWSALSISHEVLRSARDSPTSAFHRHLESAGYRRRKWPENGQRRCGRRRSSQTDRVAKRSAATGSGAGYLVEEAKGEVEDGRKEQKWN